jgi:long-chain fatty acid transport protein
MKKTIKLALVTGLLLSSTSIYATNGSNLIATGAKARAMGGTNIGISHGAESGLANGALITSTEGTEISFGGTLFMPKVSNENDLSPVGVANTSSDSAADISMIPEVSIVNKVNNNFYWGIGMWGTAGMGTDYRDKSAQMEMVTNLQLMQFGVPLAYKMDSISLSITPILQYGSLDINYVPPTAFGPGGADRPAYSIVKGSGVAQDLQFGFNLGFSYVISNFTLGAVYKSQIDMEYKGVLSNTVDLFSSTQVYTNDTLSTPEEMGIGISYKQDVHTIALDYTQIKWSSAKGYEDFEWEDQNVYSIGYEYATNSWAARLGYNYAKSPISEQAVTFDSFGNETNFNSANLSAGVVNAFNLLGFPAIIESHITMGATVMFNKTTSLDLAYVYASEVSQTYTNFVGQDITTTHSQSSLSFQLNYLF